MSIKIAGNLIIDDSQNITVDGTIASPTIIALEDADAAIITAYGLADGVVTTAYTAADATLMPKAGGTMTGGLYGTSAQFSSSIDGDSYKINGMEVIDSGRSASFVSISTTSDINVGDGSINTQLRIKKAANDVSDHLIFYNGTTRVGEIGVEDNTWLRLNQETENPIYTPRYIRADSGFFVDDTTTGIDGSGNLIGMGTGAFSGAINIYTASGEADVQYRSGVGGREWQVGTGWDGASGGVDSFFWYANPDNVGGGKMELKTDGTLIVAGNITSPTITSLTTNYTAADAAVTTAYTAADAVVTTAFGTADTAVTTAYTAADAVVTAAYIAADSDIDVSESNLHTRLGQITAGSSNHIYIGSNYLAYCTFRGPIDYVYKKVGIEHTGGSSYEYPYLYLKRSSGGYDGWTTSAITMAGSYDGSSTSTNGEIKVEWDDIVTNPINSSQTTSRMVFSRMIYGNSFTAVGMVINNKGVGVQRYPQTNDLEVEGTASKSSAGDWLANSDERIKTNIETIPDGLGIINQLRPVSFNYTDEYLNSKDGAKLEAGQNYYNFIAQEYEQVFPDDIVVSEGPVTRMKDSFDPETMDPEEKIGQDGTPLEDCIDDNAMSLVFKHVEDVPGLENIKQITTHSAMIHLVKAVQELSQQMEEQQQQIEELKNGN